MMKKHVYRFAVGDAVQYRPELTGRGWRFVVVKLGGKWFFQKGKVLMAYTTCYGDIRYEWAKEVLLEQHYSPEEKAAFDKLMGDTK